MALGRSGEGRGALRASGQRERETEDRGRVDVAGGEGEGASRQASEASAGVARVRTASPRDPRLRPFDPARSFPGD